MLQDRDDTPFDRMLDEAIADPERLGALQRALQSRISALDMGAIARRAPTARVTRPLAAAASADPYDDSLWDNMPV